MQTMDVKKNIYSNKDLFGTELRPNVPKQGF